MAEDAKASIRMVIEAVETHSFDRAERLTGSFIDLFNSEDCQKFIDEKITQINDTVVRLESALTRSLYESLQIMRSLVVENRIHTWFDSSAVDDVHLSGSSIHYILTEASATLEDDKLSSKQKIDQLWKGITERSRQWDDEKTVRKKLDDFVENWRRNTRIPDPRAAEERIRRDFEAGIKQRQSAMEKFLQSLKDDFKDLKEKLESGQHEIAKAEQNVNNVATGTGVAAVGGIVMGALFPPLAIVGAALAATALASKVGGKAKINSEIANRAGNRFLKRKEPNWYHRVQESIFNYIRGNTSDGDIERLIANEQLEEDLPEIRSHLQSFVNRSKDVLKQTKKRLPKLNKAGMIAETKRIWAFAKAILLEDDSEIKLHSKLLNEIISSAISADDTIAPVISLARMPDGARHLKLKFVVSPNADIAEINDFLKRIAELSGGTVKAKDNTTLKGDGSEFELEFIGSKDDDIRSFLGRLVGRISELTELHVRVAMLGDFDLNSGFKLTNPAFNRIYGLGLHADGFSPTVFRYLDYNGEKYFCPTGWRRISLNVASSREEFDRKYGGWHVAYHGTDHRLAATILTSGFVPTNGCYCKEEVVYFSPSIEYAAHPRYSKTYELTGKDGKKKFLQMVLQVRINPLRIFMKEAGTLPGAYKSDVKAADPNFPGNENLEWLVKHLPGGRGIDQFSDAVIIYGLMIRSSDTHLKYLPQNDWWKKYPCDAN